MRSDRRLGATLARIDGRGYKAYRELEGRWQLPGFCLHIDHVQGDPFAAPSRVRVVLEPAVAGFPAELWQVDDRRRATCDFLARTFAAAARGASRSRGLGNSGRLTIDEPGQQVLERTAVRIRDGTVEVRFHVGLPARGRRVLAEQAEQMLCQVLPALVSGALRYGRLDAAALSAHADAVEDAVALRTALRERGLIAFLADGSVLPRRSGIDDRPLRGAVVLRAPESLAVSLRAPHAGTVRGLAIPCGVTLIAGGGYHGKSTLLRAIADGVYDHLPGDGRERVVADADAVRVRAEDGRRVTGVDISSFIGELPGGGDTGFFHTDNASGSTSQAAAIAEALETGARVLLIDEDTSATNFMVRDRRMQRLVPKSFEPITPFVDRVGALWQQYGVSSVLVMGGCGDYLDVAQTVICMQNFVPLDATSEARDIVRQQPSQRRPEATGPLRPPRRRAIDPVSIDPSRGRRPVKIAVRAVERIVFGSADIDLSAVEQFVHESQLRTVAWALVWCKQYAFSRSRPLAEALEALEEAVSRGGLEILGDGRQDLAAVRKHEIAAALNRLRTLRVTHIG